MRSVKLAATALAIAAAASLSSTSATAAPLETSQATASVQSTTQGGNWTYINDYYYLTPHGYRVCKADAASLRQRGWEILVECNYADDGTPQGAFQLRARARFGLPE